MPLKTYKPTTPSQRGFISVDKSGLWKGKPKKSLLVGKKRNSGRNNLGRITSRRIGGGHKKKYRIIDFRRSKVDVQGVVERIEYDPNRSAHLALVKYDDNNYSYILAAQGLTKGSKVISSEGAEINPGNALPLKKIPVGTTIHNIEMKPGKGGQLARSAGSAAQLIGRDGKYAQIKLGSGEVRLILSECLASIGSVSNPDKKNTKIGKAGRNRWLGRRPSVRGVAMNPIDHPHGGGEGRTSGGRHPVTPWGKSTKGKRTRINKSTDQFILRRRKK
tara:strand:+ start:1171 stop:1995 length:825 start_codon:yes stop_codon:yes gene_type:complete